MLVTRDDSLVFILRVVSPEAIGEKAFSWMLVTLLPVRSSSVTCDKPLKAFLWMDLI